MLPGEQKQMRRGSPQGSALGSFLRNIFQNELSVYVRDCHLTKNADDHWLHCVGKAAKEVENIINEKGEVVSK